MFKQPEAEDEGYVNLMKEKNNRRELYPSWQSQHLRNYLGREPHAAGGVWEVQSADLGMQLRGAHIFCPSEVCRPLGRKPQPEQCMFGASY